MRPPIRIRRTHVSGPIVHHIHVPVSPRVANLIAARPPARGLRKGMRMLLEATAKTLIEVLPTGWPTLAAARPARVHCARPRINNKA